MPPRPRNLLDNPMLWSVARCSDELDLSPNYIRLLARNGTLPFVRVGSRMLFRPDQVQAWVAGRVIDAVE